MLKKVAFTMYPVQDADRARTFYEGTLGLTRGKYSPNGIWTEYDLPGGGCLALHSRRVDLREGLRLQMCISSRRASIR